MTAPVPHLQPAQLSHLCLYNPSLGPSEETFADQLVFSYSRATAAAKRSKKRINDAGEAEGEAAEQARRDEENEKLRRIGLAQGMVDFARSFSQGQPVDSIETQKSRIVLCELETDWWVLASVDLTRLSSPNAPSARTSALDASKKPDKPPAPQRQTEYSSREVSPPALLTAQLKQAHSIFLLHHGPSLSSLFVRLSRDRFCSALERFWTRFAKTWDVLLHGNPAADVFGGIKLAAGGELGFGVGEEEWGSGEREVLEDLTTRTEGMVDLIVSRFGEPARAEASDETYLPEHEALPWMGSGSEPVATDGVVFGGVGAITRPALRQVSTWVRQIYTYGEHAYGVRDNPLRERRKRRRRNPPPEQPAEAEETNGHATPPEPARDLSPTDLRQAVQRRAAADTEPPPQAADSEAAIVDLVLLPHDPRPSIHDRTASQDHAAKSAADTPPLQTPDKPGIPPPIISAVDKALERATTRADQDLKSQSSAEEGSSGNTTWGVPDQYMKYLTFGLSELGKSNKPQRPAAPKRDSSATMASLKKPKVKQEGSAAAPETVAPMSHLDPTPDGEYASKRFSQQRRQENRGHFLIGLRGNLDDMPGAETDAAATTDGSFYHSDDAGGPRTVLRTLQVECHIAPPPADKQTVSSQETLPDALARTAGKAEADAAPRTEVKRLRVLIYVHRPFIYCLLFETRTSSLSYASFYKSLHRTLGPIHKPLLSSTSVKKVAQRIEASHAEAGAETTSILSGSTGGGGRRTSTGGMSNRLPHKGGPSASGTRPIYDLIYDPRLETVHTSLPDIPEPGTAGAEGLGGQAAGWTRVDALGVHSQILSTLQAIRKRPGEYERTCKTARGWWIVGMRCPASFSAGDGDGGGGGGGGEEMARKSEKGRGWRESGSPTADSTATLRASEGADTTTVTTHIPSLSPRAPADMSRIAFLVRKSSDTSSSKATAPSSMTAAGGGKREASSSLWANLALRPMFGLGPTEEEKAGGAAEGWGPPAKGRGGVDGLAAGMGIGVDARRYVEGLFSLNR